MTTKPHHKPDRTVSTGHSALQAQLIADARALIGRPFVTLIDEPCRRAVNSAMAVCAASIVRIAIRDNKGNITRSDIASVAVQGLRAINVNARTSFDGNGLVVPSDQWGKAYVG